MNLRLYSFDFYTVPSPCPWCHGVLMRSRQVNRCVGANHTVPNLGCMGAMVYGAMVPWYHGARCLGAMVRGALVTWCHGTRCLATMVPWCALPWCLGAMVCSTMVTLCHGALVPWLHGARCRGALIQPTRQRYYHGRSL
ncbi:hypothetical protein FXO38_01038 [Capsicum annuum]|nr:hypothetical protein FXO38_01038 [Capsicum annuum]